MSDISRGEAVPDGYDIDFIDGKLRRKTPEEYVRQNVERSIVLEYGYPRENARVEFGMRVGTRKPRADIVVFHSDQKPSQATARIVFETKQAKIKPDDPKDGIGQLHSYMSACPNSEFGVWSNGDERLCFAKTLGSDGLWVFPLINDIPAYGRPIEEAERPERKNLKAATGDNLLFALRRCHNYIAPTEGRSKESAFWELLKLIFTKIEDERSSRLEFYVTSKERFSDTGQQKAKQRIARLFEAKVVRAYPALFRDADTIELWPETVAYIVAQLQGYSLLRSAVDVKGVAYEEIVGSNLRGDRGEFFTPRNACRLAVAMLDPVPEEVILDPACGTAGFLIIAMNHVLAKIDAEHRARWSDPESPDEDEWRELYKARTDYLSKSIRGLELNPDLVKAARMNMVMNNDGYGGIHQANSLDYPEAWPQEAFESVALGSVDLVFTNPPFGTRIRVEGRRLEQFDLAAEWNLDPATGRFAMRLDQGVPVRQSSRPPELLFIERALQFVKPGSGRVAMVVPNGILNNPGLAYVRQWIIEHAQILAVVDMQRDLFQPHNDTQTSMVFMRRLAPGEITSHEPVFMAVADRIGHDKRGRTTYRRDEEGRELVGTRTEMVEQATDDGVIHREIAVKEPIVDDQLPDVVDALRIWLDEHSEVQPAWRGLRHR